MQILRFPTFHCSSLTSDLFHCTFKFLSFSSFSSLSCIHKLFPWPFLDKNYFSVTTSLAKIYTSICKTTKLDWYSNMYTLSLFFLTCFHLRRIITLVLYHLSEQVKTQSHTIFIEIWKNMQLSMGTTIATRVILMVWHPLTWGKMSPGNLILCKGKPLVTEY